MREIFHAFDSAATPAASANSPPVQLLDFQHAAPRHAASHRRIRPDRTLQVPGNRATDTPALSTIENVGEMPA
jgi:hypothetical protein